jgi:hypothetical protein
MYRGANKTCKKAGFAPLGGNKKAPQAVLF